MALAVLPMNLHDYFLAWGYSKHQWLRGENESAQPEK